MRVAIIFILSCCLFNESYSHSLFNSSELVIGDFRVQIATLPEIPTTGKKSQILFKIDNPNVKLDGFTIGIRIFYSDVQIDEIRPMYHHGDHWEMDYTFKKSGNHIFKVDLYDVNKKTKLSTYVFNISTHNPFGYIFFYSIAAGSIGLGIIFCYIYIPKKIRKLY